LRSPVLASDPLRSPVLESNPMCPPARQSQHPGISQNSDFSQQAYRLARRGLNPAPNGET
jgi:hypothetical protein